MCLSLHTRTEAMESEPTNSDRCIAIIERHMDGVTLDTRRVLTAIINEIRSIEPIHSSPQDNPTGPSQPN